MEVAHSIARLFFFFFSCWTKVIQEKNCCEPHSKEINTATTGLKYSKMIFWKETLISRRDIVSLCIHSATITPKRYTGERVFQYMTSEYLEKRKEKTRCIDGVTIVYKPKTIRIVLKLKKNDGNIIAWDSPIRLTTATTLPTQKRREKSGSRDSTSAFV